MKNSFFLILCVVSVSCFAVKVTISTTGDFSFSPTLATINVGDTIVFNVGGGHTATEVTEATWNANQNTANGAFDLSTGSNQMVIGLSAGTHYFVCKPHTSMGMKGRIVVNLASGVKNKIGDNNLFSVFPNPTKDFLLLKSDGTIFNKIVITSIDGKICKEIILSTTTDKISTADLPNANYIISAYTKENDVYVQKFVKE